MIASGEDLVERARELDRLAAFLEDLQTGHGSVLAVEGPAGIGRSRLLRLLRERAAAAGMLAVNTRCAESEQQLSFAALRQTLAHFPAAPHAVAAGAGEVEAFEAALQTLAGAARDAAVLLVVDDAHWCDAESLRFLAYLAHRVESVAVGVALGVRSGEPAADQPLLQALLSEPQVQVLVPRPLSGAGVARLVERRLGETPSPAFVSAMASATRGNPFLVEELLHELDDEGMRPTDAAAVQVRELGPRGVARTVLVRIGRLGPAAVSLARAAAVLGDGTTLAMAARVARMTDEEAERALDALTRADVLVVGTVLRFAHPVVRAAIEQDLGPGETARLHARAATLLVEHDAGAEQIARHLARTQPRDDPATVATLWAAARNALARGAPETAARLLERALAEPPPAEVMAHLLRELGTARHLLGDASAKDTFALALDWTADPVDRAAIARQIASSLAVHGETESAIEILEQAASAVGGDDPALRDSIASELLSTALLEPRALARVRRRLPDPSDERAGAAARMLLAAQAVDALFSAQSAECVARLALEALDHGQLLEDQAADAAPFHLCVYALVQADHDEAARELLEIALCDAERRGSLLGRTRSLAGRATVEHASGRVDRAESDATAALAAAEEAGLWQIIPPMAGVLASARLDRLGHGAAWSTLADRSLTGALADQAFHSHLLEVRGRIRLAAGEPEGALADFEELGVRSARLPIGPTRWRVGVALAHGALGDRGTAGDAAHSALDDARAFGAPREVGVALRALGLVTPGTSGIERLREAVSVLETSHGRLELARALIDLGAALRRGGERLEARGPLRRGQAIAMACGAEALADRAVQELAATGARVGRGPADDLTPAERRVADLAASGRSNRAIAGELYLSLKTVEVHLTSVYRKLGIRSRRDLAEALEALAPPSPDP